jgi:hypothetical protein
MTRSKLELATILVKLRGDDSDPAVVAKDMSLLKLCYEIQKIEEEKELEALSNETKAEEPKAEVPLTKKEEEIVEELKAPAEATTKQRHKHILSWLLDSSSDED